MEWMSNLRPLRSLMLVVAALALFTLTSAEASAQEKDGARFRGGEVAASGAPSGWSGELSAPVVCSVAASAAVGSSSMELL